MHTEEHSLLLSHAPLGLHKDKEGRLKNKAAATQVELNGNHQFIPLKKVRCSISNMKLSLLWTPLCHVICQLQHLCLCWNGHTTSWHTVQYKEMVFGLSLLIPVRLWLPKAHLSYHYLYLHVLDAKAQNYVALTCVFPSYIIMSWRLLLSLLPYYCCLFHILR